MMLTREQRLAELREILNELKITGKGSAVLCCVDCPGTEKTYDDGSLAHFCYMTADQIQRFMNGDPCSAGVSLRRV